MAAPVEARCGTHPEVGAVDVCTRCGRFLCSECVDYWNEQPVCASCLPLMDGGAATSRAKGAPVLAVLGAVGMVAGFFLRGRRGLRVWAVAAPMVVVGLALGVTELRMIRARQAGARGRPWALTAVLAGLVGVLLLVGLLVGFLVFLGRTG